jgi:hypothetical protein
MMILTQLEKFCIAMYNCLGKDKDAVLTSPTVSSLYLPLVAKKWIHILKKHDLPQNQTLIIIIGVL